MNDMEIKGENASQHHGDEGENGLQDAENRQIVAPLDFFYLPYFSPTTVHNSLINRIYSPSRLTFQEVG